MPSTSKKQHNLMALVANNPKAAKRLNIPQSVGEEFMKADKGKKFAKGGSLFKGKESYSEELKEAKAVKSGKITPKQFEKGEKSEGHGGEERGALKMAKQIKAGKMSPSQYAAKEAKEEGMKKGGKVKKYAGGGDISVDDYVEESVREQKKMDARRKQNEADRKMLEKKYPPKKVEDVPEDDMPPKDAKGNYIKPRKYKSGGSCGTNRYARGGGIEVRGKTRGRII